MSIRAFNQYMDMHFQEHPEPDEEFMDRVEEGHSNFIDGIPNISIDNLFSSDIQGNVLVNKHPYSINNHLMPHRHDYFELIYLSRGSSTQTINSISTNMCEGDLCLLSTSDKHSISIDHESDLLFNIIIRPSLFQESFLYMITENDLISNFFLTSLFTMSKKMHYLYFPGYKNVRAGDIAQKLIIEFFEKKQGYQKAVECYLALLFTELMRSHQEQIDQDNYEIMGNNRLSAILSYISANKNSVTLTSVANEFHYHPNYLSSLIKKYTNCSFSELVQNAKLNEVCQYLKKTNISIDEICSLMGYYDRSYFNRVFKKHYHMTPGEFRRINQIPGKNE